MARPVCNSKGFTLIEMMIAILIIMVSMLALLTAITTAIRTNTGNEMRNVAARVTNQTADALLSLPIDDTELSIGTHSRIAGDLTQAGKGIPDTKQQIRNYLVNYTITWTPTQLTSDLKQIKVEVGYLFSNQTFTNTAVTYKYRAI